MPRNCAALIGFLITSLAYSQSGASISRSNVAPANPNPGSPVDSPVQSVANGQTAALIFKSIIPPVLVDDMFGHRISKDYLAIQVTVFNTSDDEDLIINDVSLDYTAFFPDACQPLASGTLLGSNFGIGQTFAARANLAALADQNIKISPSQADQLARMSSLVAREEKKTAYGSTCQTSSQELSILRGVAEKGQALDPRNITYRSLQAVGTIGGALTGVAGLGDVLPKAVAAFNGPGLSAFAAAFPDFTINQMNRLSDSAYAANTVVAKQRSKVLVAFIPLQLFFKPAASHRFRKDPYRAFVDIDYENKSKKSSGTPNSNAVPASPLGLKDLKVRVAYNFIVPTQDVPPLPATMTIDDKELLNLLQKQDVHGVIAGRFLDGATLSSPNTDLDVAPDSAQVSTDARLYFVITPRKITFPQRIDLKLTKGKDSASISKPVTTPLPTPTLTSIDPPEVTQGSDANVTLSGNNFFDLPPAFAFSRNGAPDASITASNVKVTSPTTITATFSTSTAAAGKVDVAVVMAGQRTGTQPLTIKPKTP